MPRSRQENQRIKAERRWQIMDAALKVFAQKGLVGASRSMETLIFWRTADHRRFSRHTVPARDTTPQAT